jgi:hypothetical protein
VRDEEVRQRSGTTLADLVPPMSNGEFEPRPVDDRDRLAAKLYRRLVDDKARASA